MLATKTTVLIIAIAILLTVSTPVTVFADEHRSDDHDDKKHHDDDHKDKKLYCIVDFDKKHHDDHDDKKHHDDKDLFCELVDHDDKKHNDDHDDKKHHDNERHNA